MDFRIRVDQSDERLVALLTELVAAGKAEPLGRGGGAALVLGGARSGKSTWAEAQFAEAAQVDYVATSLVDKDDAEWVERVALHRNRRPASWRTVETLDLESVLLADDDAPILVDCLALWLDRVLADVGAWSEATGWPERLEARVASLVTAISVTRREVILVSNEVGSGLVPETAVGRRYRDELGRLNTRVAAACRELWLCTAGVARRLK